MSLYKRGEKYTVKCKLGTCGKEFIWEPEKDTDKKRECCCQRHGLELIVWHTLDEILTIDDRKPGLSVTQAADCIERALQGYDAREIHKLLSLPEETVTYFLNHKSTRVRHRLDDRRRAPNKPQEEIPVKIKRQIQETFKRGDTVNGLHIRFGYSKTAIQHILNEELPAHPQPAPKPVEPEWPTVKAIASVILTPKKQLITMQDGKKFILEF